mmetsp:Transcript_4747/g.12472  ORF Transcript_4747/g.12472 Transcript_4747/m.12472 type:complete len:93 (-) Transcript_4747:810-1088(-)
MAPKRKRVSQDCGECGNDVFVEDNISGDLVCKECGLVKEGHRIDKRAEWRSFEDDKGKERAGGASNPLLSDGKAFRVVLFVCLLVEPSVPSR